MRTLDMIVVVLLVIGGLNWGLVGFFNIDIVEAIFGYMSIFARVLYCIIGLSALYYIVQWKAMHIRCKKAK